MSLHTASTPQVAPVRLERTTIRLEGGCSIQLSYGAKSSVLVQTLHYSSPTPLKTSTLHRAFALPTADPKGILPFKSMTILPGISPGMSPYIFHAAKDW